LDFELVLYFFLLLIASILIENKVLLILKLFEGILEFDKLLAFIVKFGLELSDIFGVFFYFLLILDHFIF
jgi:hypothetical protein